MPPYSKRSSMTKTTIKRTAAKDATRTTTHLRHEYNPAETNYSALSFPADHFGLATKLRREFRDAIQRCRGSDEKCQQVLDSMEVLMAWAQAKLEDDKAANALAAAAASAQAAEAARQEEFRARIQAGPNIKVTATATGFMEQSPRNGSVLAIYDTADDARGPVAAMAQIMLDEGRDPTCTLEIDAFGRPGIGSGQTLPQLAATAILTEASADAAPGALMGIRV